MVALTGCEAQTTVETTIALPASIASTERSPQHLHLVVTRASSFSDTLEVAGGRCPTFDITQPTFQQRLAAYKRWFELSQSSLQ